MFLQNVKFQREKNNKWENGYFIGKNENPELNEGSYLDNNFQPLPRDEKGYQVYNQRLDINRLLNINIPMERIDDIEKEYSNRQLDILIKYNALKNSIRLFKDKYKNDLSNESLNDLIKILDSNVSNDSNENKFRVITLCGSSKFKDDFIRIAKELTLEGNIVLSLNVFGHSGDNEVYSISGKKDMLDKMHLNRIDMSDAIFVINKYNYIGESTRNEINYAKKHNKEILYMM